MYSDCLRLESYCWDFAKVFRFVFGIVSVMFFTKKAKHTLICLKNKPPYPRFRIICFWSTKHRMLEFWNLFSWGLTLYTSSQVCLIPHRFCWCTSTSGKVLFNIIVSLSLPQEDWEGPLLVWGLFRKAVFEEEQLGFSLSLLLAGIGSQFVVSDRLSSSMVACVRIFPKDTNIFVNSFLLNDHCCLCSKLTLSRILWTSVCRW